jgi:hypothetical protein
MFADTKNLSNDGKGFAHPGAAGERYYLTCARDKCVEGSDVAHRYANLRDVCNLKKASCSRKPGWLSVLSPISHGYSCSRHLQGVVGASLENASHSGMQIFSSCSSKYSTLVQVGEP